MRRSATGLLVERDGALSTVHGGEIVLCGGAIGSPHLLLLPGVGRNLRGTYLKIGKLKLDSLVKTPPSQP